MADFTYQGTLDGVEPTERIFNVVAGAAASIASGQVVELANGYAVLVANGECDDTGFYGLAVSTSTDTVGAAGTVSVVYHATGLVVRGLPTTAGNLDPAILFDRVSMDVGGSTQTVDENAPNAAHSMLIMDYDDTNDTIDVALLSNY